jgi:hypothetical protein
VDALRRRVVGLPPALLIGLRCARRFSAAPKWMLARATEEYLRSSSARKLSQGIAQIPSNDSLVSRKVLGSSNKDAILARASQRSQAMTEAVTWGLETNGQVLIEGEVFDEADFEDIEIEDWDGKSLPTSSEQVEKDDAISHSQEYFKDDDDIDWTSVLDHPKLEEIKLDEIDVVQPPPASQPPVEACASDIYNEGEIDPLPVQHDTIQEKEASSPRPDPLTPQNPDPSLAKLLFPSSATFTWPTSSIRDPRSVKRSRTEDSITYNQSEITPSKSLLRTETVRGISTMTTEQRIDFGILGITQTNLAQSLKSEAREKFRPPLNHIPEAIRIDHTSETESSPPKRTRKQKKAEELVNPAKLANETKPLAKIFLSQEQKNVRKLVVEDKKSVFYTGSAGILT